MEAEVFITKIATFLPNNPVDNEHIEDYLGLIGGKPSRVKSIILRQNGIKTRYYALTTAQEITHTDAEMTAKAVENLFDNDITLDDVEFLSCGTSGPDQLLPSHTAMVHGLLKSRPMELMSPAGVCAAGAHAIKAGYMSIKSGNSNNAVCSGAELASGGLLSKKYEKEYELLVDVEEKPMIAFEKDFLRFMLSDGAGAMLLENKKRGEKALRIEWIDSISYAHQEEVCMYMGAEKRNNGELKGWKEFTEQEWLDKSIFAIKQDVRLLDAKVVDYCAEHIRLCLEKYKIEPSEVDYFVPHLSSMIFKEKLRKRMEEKQVLIPVEKWFMNLDKVGNVGSASIYIALGELFSSGKLKKDEKILLMIPESGRFSYVLVYLTVV